MKYIFSFVLFFSAFAQPIESAESIQKYQVTLYYSPQCPYSKKVLAYLKQSGIKIDMKNVKLDSIAREELIQRGGYAVVPCLIIDGRALYDANLIIDWLSVHQEDLSKS